MAYVALITGDKTHFSYLSSRSALRAHGHIVTGFLETELAQIGSSFDVIALVRNPRNETINAWLRDRWAAGTPLLVGLPAALSEADATHDVTAKPLGIISDVDVFHTGGNNYQTIYDIVGEHKIMEGFSGTSQVLNNTEPWYGWAVAPFYGTVIGTVSDDPAKAYMTAIEKGDAINGSASHAPGATAPARAVFCGWLRGNDGAYTSSGEYMLAQAVDWLATNPDAYADEVLSDAPLVYYHMGETSGTTLIDSSGNGRDGLYQYNYVLGQPGLVPAMGTDKSVDFPGDNTNAFVTLTGNAWMQTSQVTYEAWISPDTVAGTDELGGRADSALAFSNAHSWRVARINDTLWARVFVNNSSTTATAQTGAVFQVGGTYHVVMTFDGSTIRLYVNGALQASTAFSGTLNAGTMGLFIGRSARNDTNGFDGRIDEVAVYGTALSAERIASHYTVAQGGEGSGGGGDPVTDPTEGDPSSTRWYNGTGTSPATFEGWWDGAAIAPGTFEGALTAGVIATPWNPSPEYVQAIMADAPLVYYRLSEQAGATTLADASGNQRDATVISVAAWGQDSLVATDLDNDALATPVARITDAPWMDTTGLTVKARVKFTAAHDTTNGDAIVSRYGSGAFYWLLWRNTANQLAGQINIGGTLHGVQATTTVTLNRTYELAMTYDGTTIRLYVDGVEAATKAVTGTITTGTRDILLARYSDSSGTDMPGILDEVAIYDHALTPARIAAHYTAGHGPAGLISDDFQDGILNPRWIEADPGNIATWTESGGVLSIVTTAGGDAYSTAAANSRMLQKHDDTDFDVAAKWSVPEGSNEGVGLWMDDGTDNEYLRWDIRFDPSGANAFTFIADRVDGTYTARNNASLGAMATSFPNGYVWLRLKRVGSTVTCYHRNVDGGAWTEQLSFTCAVNANRVGVQLVATAAAGEDCYEFVNLSA